ncbi:putative transferase [Helianthus annuus]|nr:putative transferase [Helianthus annuus]
METSNNILLNVKVFCFLVSGGKKRRSGVFDNGSKRVWILFVSGRKWFVPSFYPSGTTVYKKAALSTPFIKNGDAYVLEIELRDPKIHAIEFVLKNARHDKWLKMNGASFHINLHKEIEASIAIM